MFSWSIGDLEIIKPTFKNKIKYSEVQKTNLTAVDPSPRDEQVRWHPELRLEGPAQRGRRVSRNTSTRLELRSGQLA
jgi:hypothetical protein